MTAAVASAPTARELRIMGNLLGHTVETPRDFVGMQASEGRVRPSVSSMESRVRSSVSSVESRVRSSISSASGQGRGTASEDLAAFRKRIEVEGRRRSSKEVGMSSEPVSRWSSELSEATPRFHSEPAPDCEPRLPPRRSSRTMDAELDMRVFLLDNSGSTKKEDGCVLVMEGETVRAVDTDRWCEIASIAVQHAQWCGRHQKAAKAQFALLNPPCPREPREGRDFVTVHPVENEELVKQQVDGLSKVLRKTGPCGNTPLTSRLRQMRARILRELGEAPKLALTIVTDGLPTAVDSTSSTDQDKAAFLAELQAWADTFDCSPIIRLATGHTGVCKFYRRLCTEASFFLSLVEDIKHEAKEAAAAGNGWLAYSPHVHWLRESGVLDGPLGVITERALTFSETAELLQWLLKTELPAGCKWNFCGAVGRAAAAAPPVYNGRLRRMTPLVDVQQLKEALGLTHSLAQLGRGIQGLARAVAKKVPEPPRVKLSVPF